MTYVLRVSNAVVEFPLLGSDARSIKKSALSTIGVGGNLSVKTSSVKAVDNFSIEINAGDRVCFTGPNGSGKSSLLRLISGIYRPVVGSVECFGNMVSIFDAATAVDREENGRQNVKMMLLNYLKIPTDEDLTAIQEFSGLGEFFELPVKTYSNGMFARLIYSIMICLNFDILVLDEEIGVADRNFLSEIQAVIARKLGADGVLLFASHDQNIQRSFLNRRVRMERGRLVHDERIANQISNLSS